MVPKPMLHKSNNQNAALRSSPLCTYGERGTRYVVSYASGKVARLSCFKGW